MHKILVCNRGEIALRVMKTIRKAGMKCVAIYSEADRSAPHVKFADEAYFIGPSPSAQSYLNQQRLLQVVKDSGCDAVHPGYGFLSENPDFAQSIIDLGIRFIGPGPQSIRTMGNKLTAKAAVSKYNIPLMPGSDGPVRDFGAARDFCIQMGFPVIIKASAGGGGKGMRIVNNVGELEQQLSLARSEAKNAFDDDSVFIEKYITSPRHIEIQIMADTYGNIVHLFERECSIQRRYQKLIEEAPSPAIDDDLRMRMGKTAVDVARACQYKGAGTVEFLVDEELNYYFLEMNTRLQVEHPVSEMITGYDLVKWQLDIASEKPLTISQKDITKRGHAIELRVYAEDVFQNFAPSTGILNTYRRPDLSKAYIRLDDGYEEGMEIPIYYDPLLAKLIAYGESRNQVIDRMIEAISDFQIEGVDTSLPFGDFAMNHPVFRSGKYDTHFIERYFTADQINLYFQESRKMAAAIAVTYRHQLLEKMKWINRQDPKWLNRRKT